MKICKYCGSKNENDNLKCSSCGADDFKRVCKWCSTAFDTGNFCPTCGLNVHAKKKICLQCESVYYSLACPNCGFTKLKTQNKTTTTHRSPASTPSRAQTSYQNPYTQMKGQYQPQNPYELGGSNNPYKNHKIQERKNTWLWILGWLFFFPIPLSVLIWRSKLNKTVKIVLLAILWIAVIGLTAVSNQN